MSGPLEGIRVLDLTAYLLGPFGTQILGDLGAEVIKGEPPEGDIMRRLGPSRHDGMGAVFLNLNRNKRSIVLDLKREAGREALLRLAAGADVFIHNMRPKAIAALDLGYAAVSAANPKIVYCGTYGYRHDGPYGDKPAFDDMIQGASGMAALVGRQSGEPGYVPTAFIDKTVGMAAAYAILAALFHRERSGEGQELEVPMLETMVQFIMVEHLYGLTFEPPLGGAGYPRMLAPQRRPYRTRDGHICILPYTDRQWRRFLELAGRPEVLEDPRFASFGARSENIAELYELIGEVVPERTTAQWLERLDEAQIPAMAVTDPDDLPDDPHLKATGFFEIVEHPSEGALRNMAFPIRLSRSPGELRRLAPRLGEHGREVLGEAGFGEAEIAALIAAGVTVEGG
ncbi:MAG: CoA transferase [Alphaproteobacteria bacterium]|nr:CoA transferase [Alphaproteobacteria bacterium]